VHHPSSVVSGHRICSAITQSLFLKWEGEAPAEPVPQHQTARRTTLRAVPPRPPDEPPCGTDSKNGRRRFSRTMGRKTTGSRPVRGSCAQRVPAQFPHGSLFRGISEDKSLFQDPEYSSPRCSMRLAPMRHAAHSWKAWKCSLNRPEPSPSAPGLPASRGWYTSDRIWRRPPGDQPAISANVAANRPPFTPKRNLSTALIAGRPLLHQVSMRIAMMIFFASLHGGW
jgi:hypothetical protein